MNWRIKPLLICLGLLSLTGCASINKPLDYSVEIKNKGSEKIVVPPFGITDGPVSTVDVGEVYPSSGHSIAPFYTRPFPKVLISWRSSKTGAAGSAEVPLNLPKEFTKERGSSIEFYIFPDEQKVDVAYVILNPKTGEFEVVKQPSTASH